MSEEFRSLHLLGATGKANIKQLHGRDHLVVPVVALMEGVIHAVNASTPEFVPASSLMTAPQGWNGRPIVLGHPTKNGRQISANDPEVLASSSFGQIFQSRMAGKKLIMEAWIDPQKAEAIGAGRMLQQLRDGEMVEVSVGAFVTTENTVGDHNGKSFKATWRDIVPDHLAFLPNGVGACSIEMGCGTHRAAQMITAEGWREATDEELKTARDISQATRDEMDASDFAGPDQSFPIKVQADVDAAAHLIGKAADPDAVKARIISIAKRKGLTVPDSWKTTQQKNAERNSMEKRSLRERLKALLATLAALPDKSQVVGEGSKVVVDSPGHEMHGKTGVVKQSMKGGTVHKVEVGDKSDTFPTSKLKTADAFDTPSEAASEEAAELIGYQTIRTLLDGVGKSWDVASSTVDDLISDEVDDPTETPADEDAEEEVEQARLEAIQTLCMAMYGGINSVMSVVANMLQPDDDEATNVTPRYMATKMEDCPACKGTGNLKGNPCEACDGAGELKVAAGRRNSTSDQKVIQGVHDHAVKLGADCTPGNYKMAEAAETVADPQVETLELKQPCGCTGETMTKEAKAELIKVLTEDKHSGFTPADVKMLEAASDERLESFRVAASAREKELKAAEQKQTDLDKAQADLKAAHTKTLTEEEFMAAAPTSVKTLIARAVKQDTENKADLVTALKAAQSEFTESELAAKPLEELERMGRMLKLEEEKPNYAGRGVPRAAADADDKDPFLNPPDPYAAGLAALQKNDRLN